MKSPKSKRKFQSKKISNLYTLEQVYDEEKKDDMMDENYDQNTTGKKLISK